MVPAIVIGVFILVGFGLLGFGLYSLFRKGGYFVGTPTRLVHYREGTIRSIDWEQFSGDIEVSGNEQKGNITLGMRTGKKVSRKNGLIVMCRIKSTSQVFRIFMKLNRSAVSVSRKTIPHPRCKMVIQHNQHHVWSIRRDADPNHRTMKCFKIILLSMH